MTTWSVTVDDGVELVGEFCDQRGPVTLLLHGGGQTRHSWDRTTALLNKAGLSTLAMDCRGHGRSDFSDDGDYGLARLAADVATIVVTLGRPVVLVGASMGGLTSLAAARLIDSSQLLGIALVDVVPRYEAQGADRVRTFMSGHLDGFATLDEAAEAVSAYLPHRRSPTDSSGLRKNLRQDEAGRWLWRWDPALLTGLEKNSSERAEWLESIAAGLDVPFLLVRGALSDVVSEDGVESFASMLSDVSVVEVAHAGHTAPGDNNDDFARHLVTFIRNVTS